MVLAVAAAAASAACSADDPLPGDSAHFPELLSGYIEQAEAAGASPEQLAILEEAQETGEIPFEVYNEAVDRSLRCLREAGYEPDDGRVYEEFGVTRRTYGMPVEAEADAAQMVELMPGVSEHRCFAEHSAWVDMAYGLQPSSLEARDAHFEQYREAILACLAEQGVDVEPDLSRVETERASLDAVRDGTAEVNCLSTTGYSGGIG